MGFIPFLITFYLLIPISFSIDEDHALDFRCIITNRKPFTSAFNESRWSLMSKFIADTASSNGFSSASFSYPPDYPEPDSWTYGVALCRGDVSPDDCTTCVNTAALAVIDADHCIDGRTAIIWRNHCFLKYSDEAFIGEMDIKNMVPYDNWNLPFQPYMIEDYLSFFDFRDSLSQNASQSDMLYAQGTTNIQIYADCEGCNPDHVVDLRLYGVAQCTRDISADKCKYCLDYAKGRLPFPLNGARVLGGSCNIRYEREDFLSDQLISPQTGN